MLHCIQYLAYNIGHFYLVQSFRLQPCEDQGMGNNPCIHRRNIQRTLPYPTGSSTPQARGKLALLVSLLALAILLLVPAVVFAQDDLAVPQNLTATSGDGDMTLSWSSAELAGGYEYRYTSSMEVLGRWVAGIEAPECPDAPEGAPAECTWHEAGTSQNSVSKTITGLTVGTTYYFQVRSKAGDAQSEPSSTTDELQRATPPAVENLAGTAGSQQVTLTWTHPSAYSIFNYQIRQDDGSGWGSWTDTTIALPEGEGTVTYTVSGLVNGTEYSFLVRGQNFKGDGPDGDFVTVTPSGPPAAPRDLTAQEQSSVGTDVKLTWADPEDSNIDEYQYRVRVNGGSVWDPDWTLVPNSGADTTTYTVKGLVSGTQGYEFQVRALDTDRLEGDRAGPHSSVTGTPTTSETAPEAMTNVQGTVTGVSGGGGGTVTFTWADPGGRVYQQIRVPLRQRG